jgi:hypothetical protein
MTTLDLFPDTLPAPAKHDDPLVGTVVDLPDACRCGQTFALIGAGTGPHAAYLQCESCHRHRGWVSQSTYKFLAEILQKFGCPTTPIKVRRGHYNHDPDCCF